MNIVRTRLFDRDVKRIGASEDDVRALEDALAANPQAGDVIKGLDGLRKVRFALPSRNIGKRGGARAIYLVLEVDEELFLIAAYQKNEKDDLTPADRKVLKALVAGLKGS